MTQAESSSAARNGAKAVTAGAPVDYELPWLGYIPMRNGVHQLTFHASSTVGLRNTVPSSSMTLLAILKRLNG